MYLLGVDGGGTKTEYVLAKADCTVVDTLYTGTCSHEQFSDGFDGMERAMSAQLNELFSRNGITAADIAAAGFGLAGADLPWQVTELKKRVAALGFARFDVANDGILGIKAACENGVGLCAVNGTGTVIIGANENGEILQVGGVGRLSGDNAGGNYIKDRIVAALYDFYYRCGADSVMFDEVLNLLGAKADNLLAVVYDWELLHNNMKDLIKVGAESAANNDAVAKKIFDKAGESIGKSAAGCIRRLGFSAACVDIVQVGSIWHRIPYTGMSEIFLQTVNELSGKDCRIAKSEVSAAMGGVYWAKQLL